MSAPLLQVWSAPKCQSDAQPIAALPDITSAQIRETISGADSGTITMPSDAAREAGIAEGRIIRAVVPLRGVLEWVITGVTDSAPGRIVTVALGPLRQLITLRGFVREDSGLAATFAFVPDPLTVAEFLTQYVLTNLADDGLSWLSLGTVEYTDPITPGRFDMARRGELLTLIEKITGYEVQLRRLSSDAGYAIDVLQRRGESLPTVLVELPATALSIGRIRDLTQTATAVVPIGADSKAMGEVDWTGGSASGAGPYYIPLTDPVGGNAPIREDGQFVNAYARLPDGTALLVTGSRASDSAIQVSALGSYTTGARLILSDTDLGRPISRISSPSALADARGLIVAKVTAKGARQERTLNQNGDFTSGAASWTPDVNGVRLARADLGRTVSFAANGARSAGTAASTVYPVDGLSPGTTIYHGDQMVLSGTVHTFAADTVPSTSGVVTATITPALTVSYADNTAISITRQQKRTLVKDGTQSVTSGIMYLTMRDQDTDGLLYRKLRGATLVHDASGLVITLQAEYVSTWSYTSNFCGTGTVRTSGYSVPSGVTVPAVFADGDTFTLVFSYNALTLNFDGVQSSAATTVTFKAVAGLARRDWTTSDVVYVSRSNSASVTITAFNAGTSVATINTSTSTLDDVASYRRDDFANIDIGQGMVVVSYTVDGASPPYQETFPWTVLYISGSSMGLSLNTALLASRLNVDEGSISVGSITSSYTWPATFYPSWISVEQYPVTASTTWGSNGRATVSISLPSGRTIQRGEPLRTDWAGNGVVGAQSGTYTFPTTIFAHATVTGPASAVVVAGWDDLYPTAAYSPTPVGVFRLFGGTGSTKFSFPGETYNITTTVVANGSGAANVSIASPNTLAVPDNAPLAITRPALFAAGERTTGSTMRLLYAPGSASPTYAAPSVQSASAWVPVASGERVTVTAVARFRVTPESLAIGQAPLISLVNQTTGVMLSSGTISGTTVYAAPFGEIECVTTATLTASAFIAIRLMGGSTGTYSRWHICTDAAMYVGTEVLAYAEGARSRIAFQRGQDVLAQRKSSARYTVRGLDQAALAGSGTPIQIGQPVRLRSDALALDTTERIVALTWRWPGAELVEIECAALTPRLTDVDVS